MWSHCPKGNMQVHQMMCPWWMCHKKNPHLHIKWPNSFDHAQQWDNKVYINIEGHNTLQDMLEIVGSCVSNPPHHNTGRENQCIKIFSHIHPSPLHSKKICETNIYWETLKVLEIIFWNLWRQKLINMS